MISKVALITGVTGQDGSLLAEFLLDKGYKVHGIVRRASSNNTRRIDHLTRDTFFLHYGDMTDTANLVHIIDKTQPDEIYNLAAQSHVAVSFESNEYTSNVNAMGTLRLLEAVRILDMIDEELGVRFYQASTSEMFGNSLPPQNEKTPFRPENPYAVAKLYAYWMTINYREAYGMHASNGILFNHESTTRGETFVTRKITKAVAHIKAGLQETLYLGNLDAVRDWGHAKDYVEGMWLMLQQEKPGDYVLATGESHSVREFVTSAFRCVGIGIKWLGTGIEETGRDAYSGKVLVKVGPEYFRLTEVNTLLGDPTKAREQLGWHHRIGFEEMVHEMVDYDRKQIEGGC